LGIGTVGIAMAIARTIIDDMAIIDPITDLTIDLMAITDRTMVTTVTPTTIGPTGGPALVSGSELGA
jgi:hypothetical protein